MSATTKRLDASGTADARAVLKLLQRASGTMAARGTRVRIARGDHGAVTIAADALTAMVRDDLVVRIGDDEVAATEAGLAWLRRVLTGGEGAFRAQHGAVTREVRPDPAGGMSEVAVDLAESPLGWLSRRPGPDGRPWIDVAQLAAAERLRLDFTKGGLTPRITQTWEATGSRPRRAGVRGGLGGLGDMAMEARARMNAALEAVGPELSGILVDVCCFLKGLEAIERERRWPPRSSKVILALALDRLAAHYGIARVAAGPETTRPRHWGTADYRPKIT